VSIPKGVIWACLGLFLKGPEEGAEFSAFLHTKIRFLGRFTKREK
jgi:hypothetical protein